MDCRAVAKQVKSKIKEVTSVLNTSKGNIDSMKAALDRKEDERKMRHREE